MTRAAPSPASVASSSPCIGVCRLDQARVCLGCGRAIDEIAAWPLAAEDERERIRQAARQRLSIIQAPRPGVPP